MDYKTTVWISQFDPAIVFSCFVAAGVIAVVGLVYAVAYKPARPEK